MSRPDRWWRPSTTRRPPLRARRRQMYSGKEMDATFDVAYECGRIAERKRWRDDLLEVADAAGVMPTESDVNGDIVFSADAPEQLVDEVERWLRDQ